MMKHLPNITQARRKEVMSYLECSNIQSVKASPANLILFKNGVLDINTMEFREPSPDMVFTNRINHNYVVGAYNPDTDKTLNKLACNREEIRILIEEMIGYCFFRRSELRKAFILVGGKRNGKSTFLDMLIAVLGEDNTSALDLSELSKEFKTAELAGKLANIGDDIDDGFISNVAIFKKLVSGNRMTVARKYEQPFDFSNYAKLIFSANEIPRMKDKTNAVMDRMIIVPFDAVFTSDAPDYDPFIKDKLLSESSLEYCIQLGVKALRGILERGAFTESDLVKEQLKEYEKTNNPALQFFEEIGGVEGIENQLSDELYSKYRTFCSTGNFTPVTKAEFSKQVSRVFGLKTKQRKIDGKVMRFYVKG